MNSARREILGSIRDATAPAPADRESQYSRIPRDYRQTGSLTAAQRLDLFRERLHDYGSTTHLCGREEIPATIATVLRRHPRSQILVPPDIPPEWLSDGIEFIPDRSLDLDLIQSIDGVLTACSVAIAITGTIVLHEGAPAQGRRVLSLLPDYHLCLVGMQQIVETVPEGIHALQLSCTLPTTTISGPSATADIEMVRVRGVHGPRTLEVIVFEN